MKRYICLLLLVLFLGASYVKAQSIIIKSISVEDDNYILEIESSSEDDIVIDYKTDDKDWKSTNQKDAVVKEYSRIINIARKSIDGYERSISFRVKLKNSGTFSNIISLSNIVNFKNYSLWAYKILTEADKLDIINKTNMSDMKAFISKADFIRSLMKALEYNRSIIYDYTDLYKDIGDKYLIKAIECDILKYADKNTFDKNIRREEAAVIIYRAMIKFNLLKPSNNKITIKDPTLSSWATEAVRYLSCESIMNLDKSLSFKAKENITVEQAIAAIMRIIKK